MTPATLRSHGAPAGRGDNRGAVRRADALAAGLFALLAAVSAAAAGQPVPPDTPASHPLPPFTLPDLEGRMIGASTFEGRSPVLVVFVKGTWCPHCVDLLIELETLKATDLARIPVLVISPQPAPQTVQFLVGLEASRKIRLTHTFLTDAGLRFGPRYGLAREVSGRQGRPASVLYLDREGRQVWGWTGGHDQSVPVGPSLHQRLEEMRVKTP